MCLTLRLLVAVALLGAGAALTSPGYAQTANPKSDAIVKALTPTGPGVTGPSRGIRMANPTSSGPAPSGNTPAAAAPSGNAPSVNLSVQFESGSADLTAAAMQTLNELGKALNEPALAPYRFRIEGHTDTVGTTDYNKELSDRRAAAVVDYLAATFKVDRSRLEAVGMGEQGLLVPTADQTSEPRNRRVAVVNIGQ
jgi:outer membrane protein OmpA-like peptidoglycan-associated protein